MPAFERAVEIGVDALEMDVHVTRDDHLVVVHDPTGMRTTGARCSAAASTSAVSPSQRSRALTSALWPRSSATRPALPVLAAAMSGVSPSGLAGLTCAPAAPPT